jgi:hypothetical protein
MTIRRINTMRRISMLMLPALASLASAAGCSQNSGGGEPTMPPPRAQFFWPDVPVPDKFEIDRRRSNHAATAGHRTIKHYYLGSASPLAVSNFYRQKMPEYQWELVDKQLRSGADVMNYRKNSEVCEVRIEEVPSGMFGSTKTQVTVDIRSSRE